MVEASRTLSEGVACPICGTPLEAVRTRPEEGAVSIEEETRFPALYRCGNADPHCWEDVPSPGAPPGRRRAYELRPRRCGHDERYGGGETRAAAPGPRSHPD